MARENLPVEPYGSLKQKVIRLKTESPFFFLKKSKFQVRLAKPHQSLE